MIHVVRHGRTAANAGGLLLGRADPPLDPAGIEQARAAAVVVSSPLQRCTATAAALVGQHEVDDRFVELDYGSWDLTPLSEVPPELWDSWRADPHFRPSGGETLAELADRVSEGLEHWVTVADGRDLVVVSHVSPIKAALAWALGVGIEISWRAFVAQASITRISVTARGPSLHAFNDVAHLAAVVSPGC